MIVSVGMLAMNEAGRIANTLRSLFQQSVFAEARTLPDAHWELIVVPNGCSDATAEVARTVLAQCAPRGAHVGGRARRQRQEQCLEPLCARVLVPRRRLHRDGGRRHRVRPSAHDPQFHRGARGKPERRRGRRPTAQQHCAQGDQDAPRAREGRASRARGPTVHPASPARSIARAPACCAACGCRSACRRRTASCATW